MCVYRRRLCQDRFEDKNRGEFSRVMQIYILNVVVADGHVPERERSVFFLRVD